MLNMKKRRVIAIFSSFVYIFCASSSMDNRIVVAEVTNSRSDNIELPRVKNSEASIKNLFIGLAYLVGKIRYIYGGGRNIVNGVRAIDRRGVPKVWFDFSAKQNDTYNWIDYSIITTGPNGTKSLAPNPKYIKYGTDCSGLMALLLQNTCPNCKIKSFVAKAKSMARYLSSLGLGTFVDFGAIKSVSPGDIISMNCSYNDKGQKNDESHVFLAFGQFSDGSLLIGDMSGGAGTVLLRGTRDDKVSRDGSGRLTSEAIDVAKYCLMRYFRDIYEGLKLDIYDKYICGVDDYKLDSKMHWYTKGPKAIISDSEGYQNMSGYEVVSDLFGEKITRESVLIYLNKNNKLNKPNSPRGRKPHHGRGQNR